MQISEDKVLHRWLREKDARTLRTEPGHSYPPRTCVFRTRGLGPTPGKGPNWTRIRGSPTTLTNPPFSFILWDFPWRPIFVLPSPTPPAGALYLRLRPSSSPPSTLPQWPALSPGHSAPGADGMWVRTPLPQDRPVCSSAPRFCPEPAGPTSHVGYDGLHHHLLHLLALASVRHGGS